MRHRIGFCIALFVLLSVVALAQDTTASSGPRPTAPHGFSRKAVSLSGALSDDGKFFLADPDAEVWAIANPESCKGQPGQRITIQAQTNTQTSEIRVLRVRSPERQPGSTASYRDAAFRR